MIEIYINHLLFHSLISFKTQSTRSYSVLAELGWAVLGTKEITTKSLPVEGGDTELDTDTPSPMRSGLE